MLSVQRQEPLRMLDSRPHDHVTAVRSRHSATDQNDFFRFAHLHDLKILNCHTLVPEVPWHSLVLPNSARCRTIADCADAPVCFRTVRRTLSMKIMLFHHPLKSFSFRSANHIYIVACLKLCNAQIDLAFGKISPQAKLAHKSLRLDPGLLELPKQRLGNARFLLHAKSNLHGRITFVFCGQPAQQNVIAGCYHGHRTQSTFGVVNAGHTDFLSKKSDAHDRAIANVSEAPPLKS